MVHKVLARVLLLFFGFGSLTCLGQESGKQDSIPVAVQWTLDAGGPVQRTAIKSIVLLYCPKTEMKGTGFLLSTGLIVTNNHVVQGCTAAEMQANPFGAQQFGFDKMATDGEVDLAALHPSKHLAGGLDLGLDEDPPLGTEVNTWGLPPYLQRARSPSQRWVCRRLC